MYKKTKYHRTSIKVNQSTEGEPMFVKVQRLLKNREPIDDGVPLIFTAREDGVNPALDPRTDRFDEALKMKDLQEKMKTAKGENAPKLDNEDKPEEAKKPKDNKKKEGPKE